MRNIISIIAKNFKLLLRSKSSALIIVIGPLLVIFLVGIAFDNMDKYSINVGVYSPSYTSLTDSFITKMQENSIKVTKMESTDACIQKIKEGTMHTCIEFPKDFSVESGNVNDLVFHVDYSKMNLVWTILDTLSTEIEEQSSDISMGLTQILLDKLESVQVQIYNLKPSVAELKTQNEQMISQLSQLKQDVLSVKVKDLKESAEGIKLNILTKVASARNSINTTKTSITTALSSANVSNSTISGLDDKLSLIDTYLYNIYSILEDPNNMTESDWTKIMNIIALIEKDFSGIQIAISQLEASGSENSKKMDSLQLSLDSIYNDIESIKITNATTIVNPVNTVIKPVMPEKSYLNYLFPSLIILVVMFISILLSTTLVMMEKHSPANFRTFLAPTGNLTFIISTYLTNILLVFVQVAIILAISAYFFKSQIASSFAPVLAILFIATSLFTFIGMAIGYLFKSEETATLAAISTGSIFLFLSNVILPLESMPEYISNIAQFNPFVIAEGLVRKSILFHTQLGALSKEIYTLVIYALALFLLIWVFHILSKKHPFHRIHPHNKKKLK